MIPNIYTCMKDVIRDFTSMTLFFNRHQRRREPNKGTVERLRKLDAVSPTRTLEEWWTRIKNQADRFAADADAGSIDSQFTCAVCLDPVLGSQEIHELKCLHVFHKECLEKWFLHHHFNCPLCHRAYYFREQRPATSDWLWMV